MQRRFPTFEVREVRFGAGVERADSTPRIPASVETATAQRATTDAKSGSTAENPGAQRPDQTNVELGCFATVDIPAGAHIWTFTGPTLTYAEMAERVRAGVERSSDDPLQVDTDSFMDLDAPAVCFNHSCGPNASLRGTADLVALRTIHAGEEITYDYSLTIPASNPWVMEFACACGSPVCRGRLGNRCTVQEARALLAMGALQDFIAREMEGCD